MAEPTTVELKVYGKAPTTCGDCHGSGEVEHAGVYWTLTLTCPACGGTGEVYDG